MELPRRRARFESQVRPASRPRFSLNRTRRPGCPACADDFCHRIALPGAADAGFEGRDELRWPSGPLPSLEFALPELPPIAARNSGRKPRSLSARLRALPSESRWPPVKPNETLRFRSPSFLHAVSNPWESVEACDYFAAGQVIPTDKESTLPAWFPCRLSTLS